MTSCLPRLVFALALFTMLAPFINAGSILHSRIGYNTNEEKRVFVRGSSAEAVPSGTTFSLHNTSEQTVYTGTLEYYGEKWNIHWWIADFSELNTEGVYTCKVEGTDGFELVSNTIKIGDDLLWNESWRLVAINQLEDRIELRNQNKTKHGPAYVEGGGWQDCGSELRETNSHATMLVGLLDLLELSPDKLTADDKSQLMEQIIVGTDYLAFCQDKGRELGKGEGAIIHEWPAHTNIITGDVAKGALSFARAALALASEHTEKSQNYLARAKRSFDWLNENGPIYDTEGKDYDGNLLEDNGFDPRAYGAPAGTQHPDEWKTRDLLMMTWAAVELSKSDPAYKDKAIAFAQRFLQRQITEEQAESGYYGHFRAFESTSFSEKAWEHHHMGFDAGATFPHYIIPLMQMAQRWPDHPDVPLWDKAIRDFAYGYFLPACTDNPFKLLPTGYFEGQGILTFSGIWHGINGAYGSAAALALDLAAYTKDAQFKKIVTGNLQWIAGLNAGVEENGKYVSKSMIYGVGEAYAGSWTKVPGTICNGFDSSPQFYITEPLLSTDAPKVFTDEGWITHSGGWLSALSRL